MCIICSDPKFSKLSELEKLNAYEEMLLTKHKSVVDNEEALHILDLLLELKMKVYGEQKSI